ncbi:MAG: LptF/LptG family permease, partial [Longimicrobiales bacterium]
MRILTRYLIRAHIGPFLFALGTLTGVLLVNTIARRLQELAGKGLPFGVIAEVFVLSVPHTLALTVPMAVLVAVLYTFAQLAAENEITALKASGVNLVRLMVPLLIAASVLSAGMIWFMDDLLPETNHRLANLLVDVARKSPTLELKEQVINEIRTGDYQTRYYLRAADIDPVTNELQDIEIFDLSGMDRFRTIYADSGQMAFNQARTDLFLTLFDGWIHQTDESLPGEFQRVFFDEQRIRIEGVGNQLERGETTGYRSDREMTLAMLDAEVRVARHDLVQLAERSADAAEELTAAALRGPGEQTLELGERAVRRAPSGLGDA